VRGTEVSDTAHASPCPCQWAVLQGSLQHRVARLPHVDRWAHVENALTDTANVADAALTIGQCQVQPGSEADAGARVQLELPLSWRHGAPSPLTHGGLCSLPLLGIPHERGHGEAPRAIPAFQQPCWRGVATRMADAARTCRSYRLPRRYRGWSMRTQGPVTGTEGHLQHNVRLLSCASRASSIWLTSLPVHNALTLSSSAFCNAFQVRLGLPPRPMRAPM
jgi:hypothetical protein